MKLKFLAVSKDSSFKMDKAKFEEAGLDDTVEFEMVPDNTTPLPVLYNKELRKERGSPLYDGLIFMHGDVSFNVKAFVDHLKEVYGKYDIIGLCGTSTLNVSQSPLNWWTGSNPTPFTKWGCVTHGELGDQTSWFSEHSPNVMDAEVACIDGLCIIFTKRALESKIEFDESLGAFDFYDTDLSMQAVATYKLKLGVMVQKDLCHYSVGRSILTSNFLDTEEKFRTKWKLPVPVDSPLAKRIEARMAAAGDIMTGVAQ